MDDIALRARLQLYGPFALTTADGVPVPVSSRKAQAMMAMLARTPGGARSRAWVIEKLWSCHDRDAAMNGLRRELSQLRSILAAYGLDLIRADTARIWLALDSVELLTPVEDVDLLEGIDIVGEEEFEDWLREARAAPLPRPPALPLPLPPAFTDRPALAVLPIAPLGDDADVKWLAEGLSDDLLASLSRLRWLPVISTRASGEPVEIARSVGASYVLDGRLIHQHGSYWFSCQLQEVANSRTLWSVRQSLKSPHAAGTLDQLLYELTSAIDWRVDDAEQQRAQSLPEEALSLRELIWRGRWHQNRLTESDLALAGQFFKAALEQAPDSALTQIEWAQHLGYRVWNTRADADATAQIRNHARRAIVIDPHDPRGHMLAGMAETWLGNIEPAELLLRRALELNPSLPMTLDQLATLYNLTGRSAQAVEPLELSIRLAPSEFRMFYKHGELALAHLFCGRLDQAVAHARQSLSLRPAYWHAHVILIAALAESGRQVEARSERQKLSVERPNFRPDYIEWVPFTDRRYTEFLKAAVVAQA